MSSKNQDLAQPKSGAAPAVLAAASGLLLGLALLKFGNPVNLDRLVAAPADLPEFLVQPWPLSWGYGLLALVAVAGFAAVRAKPWPRRWLWLMPLGWLLWQGVAALDTVDGRLTQLTLTHFAGVVGGFYLGVFALSRAPQMTLFWAPLLGAFLLVVWAGFDQHYGGLEATRKFVQSQPGWERLHPEYLKRLASDRIFATLLYPNALAGVLLLLTPALTVAQWRLAARLTRVTRAVLAGLLLYGAGACLYWSGSKAGWLIAVVLAIVLLLHRPMPRPAKLGLAGVVVAAGLIVFAFKFSAYFGRGAPSVGARFQYWRAAALTALRHPVNGSGPGTFPVMYRQLKPPEAEMAQLAHNDYLEQASDSGLPGAAAYAAAVAGSLIVLHRRCRSDALRFAVWLGLLGWSLQSLVEFGLYIPAVGWTAFWLLGWLWGLPDPPAASEFDRRAAPPVSACPH